MGIGATSVVVFACVAAGAMFGLFLRSVLPVHHLSAESRDVVKLGIGLIGTMTALLLGMQLGSAKESYDAADAEIRQIAGKVSYLDRALANYGPETGEARKLLRAAVARAIDLIWSGGGAGLPSPAMAGGEPLYYALHQLAPESPAQAALKTEALSTATEIARLRWLMFAEAGDFGSVLFLVVVAFWLTLVFAGFGLLGTPNATVVFTLLLCALSASAAIGLILEMNKPFSGLIQVSSAPLRNALSLIGT